MRKPTAPQLAQLARALAQVYGVNIPDFDRAFEQLYTPFNTLVIDLARAQGQSAAGDLYPGIGGDFIYVDPDSSALNAAIGSVSIELNDQTNADKAGFTANPGFALNAVFTSLKIRYTNQPGKRLVLKYSTGFSVIPSFSALSQISGTVQVASSGPHTNSARVAGAASALAAAASAIRKYIAFQVPPTQPAGIYLTTNGGAAAVGAGNFYVAPGQTWEPPFAPTLLCNAIREGGVDINYTVIEGS